MADVCQNPEMLAKALAILGHDGAMRRGADLGACMEAAGMEGASRLVADLCCESAGDSDREAAAATILSRLYRVCYFDFLRSCADPTAAAEALREPWRCARHRVAVRLVFASGLFPRSPTNGGSPP